MPANDLALIVAAARAAGEIALRHWGKSPASWDKDAGQGPVSVADIEVNDMLHQRLTTARPIYGWLSEETPDTPARHGTPAQFVIDPIDGTRAFLEGQPSFSHAIAVVRDGRPVAAVVHLPVLGLTYTAISGGGAHLNGQALATPDAARLPGARLLTNRAAMDPAQWPGGVPDVERHFRPSLAWRLCLVAEGAFDGMVTLRPAWEWDTAAATLIATEAGACVTDRHGRPLAFNRPDPRAEGVLAASGTLHGQLLDRLPARPVV